MARNSHSGGISDNAGFWSLNAGYGLRVVNRSGGSSLTLNIPRGVLRGPPLICYWLTSVEINKHRIFDTNNA